MRMKNNKKLIFVIGIAVVLVIVGVVVALNGFFGGGGRIPEDTFTRGLGPIRNLPIPLPLASYGVSRFLTG